MEILLPYIIAVYVVSVVILCIATTLMAISEAHEYDEKIYASELAKLNLRCMFWIPYGLYCLLSNVNWRK